MNFDMWGAEQSGARVAERDQLHEAETMAGIQNTLGQIAMRPLMMEEKSLSNQKARMELESEQRMAAILANQAMGGGKPSGPRASMGDVLDDLARQAAGAGLLTKATTLAKDAALIRSRESIQLNHQVQQNLNRLKAIRENAELDAQIFGGAKSPEDWDAANALYSFQTGRQSPYANVPYSPELIQQLNETALDAKERADLLEKKLTREATRKYRNARLEQINTQNDIRERRLKLEREREARLAKSGGGRGMVSSPTTAEQDQIARAIRKDYPNIEASDLSDAAFSIAAEARSLRKQNPALDASQALAQAYDNARQAGDFTDISGMFGKKTKFGRGWTASSPAILPKDKTSLKIGKYYVNPKGLVRRWTKEGFISARPLSDDNSRLDEDLDELDEDEE